MESRKRTHYNAGQCVAQGGHSVGSDRRHSTPCVSGEAVFTQTTHADFDTQAPVQCVFCREQLKGSAINLRALGLLIILVSQIQGDVLTEDSVAIGNISTEGTLRDEGFSATRGLVSCGPASPAPPAFSLTRLHPICTNFLCSAGFLSPHICGSWTITHTYVNNVREHHTPNLRAPSHRCPSSQQKCCVSGDNHTLPQPTGNSLKTKAMMKSHVLVPDSSSSFYDQQKTLTNGHLHSCW